MWLKEEQHLNGHANVAQLTTTDTEKTNRTLYKTKRMYFHWYHMVTDILEKKGLFEKAILFFSICAKQ